MLAIKSGYLIYVDDLKILKITTDDNDVNILQQDIDELSRWCEKKPKLIINKSDLFIGNQWHTILIKIHSRKSP